MAVDHPMDVVEEDVVEEARVAPLKIEAAVVAVGAADEDPVVLRTVVGVRPFPTHELMGEVALIIIVVEEQTEVLRINHQREGRQKGAFQTRTQRRQHQLVEDEECLVVPVVSMKQEEEDVGEEEAIVGGEEGATAEAIGRERGSPITIGHGTVV